MKRMSMALALVLGLIVIGSSQTGLHAGDRAGAFNVYDCTGPAKGQSLCYCCRYGRRPVISLFAREINAELAGLIEQIDKQVAEHADASLAAFVVVLTEDPEEDEAKLQELAERHKIENVPLTLFDGFVGPADYKLDEEAALTVMMWKDQDIRVKQGFASGEFKKSSIKDVLEQTTTILE